MSSLYEKALYNKARDFTQKRIVVLGDIMLDKYTKGRCRGLSPEDIVPILDISDKSYSLGGAANTARIIHRFGSIPYLLGVIGKDEQGSRLLDILNREDIPSIGVETDETRRTTLKERIVGISAHHQPRQIVRLDEEDRGSISRWIEERIIVNICGLDSVDAFVISDYAKGVITKEICEYVIKKAKELGKKLVIDPRPQNADFYRNAFIITPNTKEAVEMARQLGNYDNPDITKLGIFLRYELKSNILITRGEDGMSLFPVGEPRVDIPTDGKEVFDVTGAGDTVTAALAVALSNGLSLEDSARFANYAAGIKVNKFGSYAVSMDEVLERLNGKE